MSNGKDQELREYFDYTRGSWEDDPGEAFRNMSFKEKQELRMEMLKEKQSNLEHAEDTNDPMNITPSYNQKHKARMLDAFPQVPPGKLISNLLNNK